MSALLKLYHSSPPPVQAAAASLRGCYLRAWRYGRNTERLIEEARSRERWTEGQWKEWQDVRVAFLLDRAATRVPYYRDHWASRRRRGDRASWHVLENWPVLEKESLRQSPEAFVADDRSRRFMLEDHTSGTSGTPLRLWFTRQTVQEWYALFELRVRMWHGTSRQEPWAMLGGQLVIPPRRSLPPFWVWNAALSQLYLSVFHLSRETVPHYARALTNRRVSHIIGYPSALAFLSELLTELDIPVQRPNVVICNAEPLDKRQEASIAQAFGCPVRATYGMSEIVAAASECPDGTLHLWPEVGLAEVADGSGDLICTGLLNPDMPLIRYRVGDRAAGPVRVGSCPCGRSLPAFGPVLGRSDDVIYTRDGRAIGRLDGVFKADLPIREAQIVQETVENIRVLVVPADGYSQSTARSIASRLEERLGAVQVLVEEVDQVPRTSSGKFRAVISKVRPSSATLRESLG